MDEGLCFWMNVAFGTLMEVVTESHGRDECGSLVQALYLMLSSQIMCVDFCLHAVFDRWSCSKCTAYFALGGEHKYRNGFGWQY
jgi:hypothetical protein